MIHVLFASVLLSQSLTASALPQRYCRIVSNMLQINLPPNRDDKASEIQHGSVVFYGGGFVGFLYRTNDGAMWYQDGLVAQKNPASPEATAHVIRELRIDVKRKGEGSFTLLPPASLRALVDGNISLQPCF